MNKSKSSASKPLALHGETVSADWVDYNGHMNVAYYVLIFDHATDALLDFLKLDAAYREHMGGSVFVVESHLTYEREVMGGVAVSVTTQILGSDAKRLHLFHRMFETGSEQIVATNELMILHMNMNTRRVAPFPEFAATRINDVLIGHKNLAKPQQSSRIITIPDCIPTGAAQHNHTLIDKN